MPTGTIAADDYIDDPNRTVAEMQTTLNQTLDYLRSLQTELAALSDTTIREGAVRTVGTGANELPDKEILDSRLSSYQTKSVLDGRFADHLPRSEFNPVSPTLVWSGSATSVNITSLSESGPGLYIVRSAGLPVLSMYVYSTAGTYQISGGSAASGSLSYTLFLFAGSTPRFVVRRQDASGGNITDLTIYQIWKV